MKPPTRRDGGYGWIIVLAFFLAIFMIDGIRLSIGIMYVEFLKEFKKGKGETAWIGSITVGVYNLCGPILAMIVNRFRVSNEFCYTYSSGPIFAMIVNKFECRTASAIGGIIACLGFVTSFFATEVYHLYFTYGVMQGFGFGLMHLTGSVVICRYFLIKRSLAFGLSHCGSGVGLFAFMPLIRVLLDTYTWRGTMLIYAGLALNGCVFGALYRPFINYVIAEDTRDEDCDLDAKDKTDKMNVNNGEIVNGNGVETSVPLLTEQNHPLMSKVKLTAIGNENSSTKSLDSTNSGTSGTCVDMRREKLDSYIQNSTEGSHQSINISIRSFNMSHRSIRMSDQSIINTPVLSQSILGSIVSKRGKRRHIELSQTLNKDIQEEVVDNVYSCTLIKHFFPKRLVTDINFILMMFAAFLFGLSAFVPFNYLPDYSMRVGCLESESGWMISVIGIAGILSRIASGLISDIPCVHRLSFLAVSFLMLGVLTLLVPVFTSFGLLVFYSFAYGLSFGVVYVVQPVVLLDYFGEEYIAQLLGVKMFTYGIANLIGSPIAGWIFDLTGDYTITFLFAGSLFLMAGIMQFAVLCTQPSRVARKHRRQETMWDTENDVDSVSK